MKIFRPQFFDMLLSSFKGTGAKPPAYCLYMNERKADAKFMFEMQSCLATLSWAQLSLLIGTALGRPVATREYIEAFDFAVLLVVWAFDVRNYLNGTKGSGAVKIRDREALEDEWPVASRSRRSKSNSEEEDEMNEELERKNAALQAKGREKDEEEDDGDEDEEEGDDEDEDEDEEDEEDEKPSRRKGKGGKSKGKAKDEDEGDEDEEDEDEEDEDEDEDEEEDEEEEDEDDEDEDEDEDEKPRKSRFGKKKSSKPKAKDEDEEDEDEDDDEDEDEKPSRRSSKSKSSTKEKSVKKSAKKSAEKSDAPEKVKIGDTTVVSFVKKRPGGGPKSDLIALIPKKGIKVKTLLATAKEEGLNTAKVKKWLPLFVKRGFIKAA